MFDCHRLDFNSISLNTDDSVGLEIEFPHVQVTSYLIIAFSLYNTNINTIKVAFLDYTTSYLRKSRLKKFDCSSSDINKGAFITANHSINTSSNSIKEV